MAVNNFLVWAGGSNANVLTQAEYIAAPNLVSGVVAGKASGQQANKTWRQSSVIASTIAQFIVDRTGSDVIDDGTIATIEANFIRAIQSLFVIPNTGVTPGTYGPTVSLTVEADGRVTALANANLLGTGLTPGTYVAPTITVGADGRISGITSVAYGPLASANAWTALNTYASGIDITGFDTGSLSTGMQWRTIQGNYGAGFRNDGTSAFLLQTASGQQTGVWNGFRPFSWLLSNGAVTIDGTGAGTHHGGAVTNTGITFFGTSGQFYANPSLNGSQLLSFSSNQYLEFNPASGFLLNTTGDTSLIAPSGVFTSASLSVGTTLSSVGNATLNGVLAGLLGDGNYGIQTPSGAYFDFDTNAGTPAVGSWFTAVPIYANNVVAITGTTYVNMFAANFVVSSDEANKTNVQDLSAEDAIAFVASVPAKRFTRNGNTEAGFIAQDIQHTSFGHMVRKMGTNPDHPTGQELGLNFTDPIAYHHAVIKSLISRLDAIEGEISDLKNDRSEEIVNG